MSGLPIWCEK